MKDKTTAGILALLLGGLGIHRFYLNQGGLGLAYLLFCWTFIPAIIALFDGIVLLSMSDEAFNEKYNEEKPLKARESGNGNIAKELESLHGLMEKGIITEEEFQVKKAQLLK